MQELLDAPIRPERLEFSRSHDLQSVEIILAENCARQWRVLHHTYTVCTVLSTGVRVEWKYRNKLLEHSSDALLLMEPGEVHADADTPRTRVPRDFRVLQIDPSILDYAARELRLKGMPHWKLTHVTGETNLPLRRAFLALHTSLERPSTLLENQSLFSTCLRLLLEQCSEAGGRPLPSARGHPGIKRARDFLHEHVSDSISLQDLVGASGGLNQFQLVRDFSACFGLPPHSYQLQLRVIQARKLLASGLSSAQVAAELGFADQSHFSRHFSRVIGVTPGAYARATAYPTRHGVEYLGTPHPLASAFNFHSKVFRKNVQDSRNCRCDNPG